MYKIAVCFAGFIRCYEKYFDNIKNNLLLNGCVDTYFYGLKHIDTSNEYINKFIDDFKFKKCIIKEYTEDFLNEINIKDKNKLTPLCKNRLSMFYNIFKSIQLVDSEYDIVIRARTDIIIKKPLDINDLDEIIKTKSIMIPEEWCYRSADRPHAVADTFAIGDQKSMEIYSNVINTVTDNMDLHPETLLGNHLFNKNVKTILKSNWIYDIDHHEIRKTKIE
jgi:hypothetical protein